MANGIELATAYVSLAVSGKDVASSARRELRAVEREADRAGQSSGKKLGSGLAGGIARNAAKIVAPIGVAIAGLGIGRLIGDAISAGSDRQQVLGGVEAVFKKDADKIKATAEQAADSFGLSQNAYMEMATILGAGLKNKGLKDFSSQTQNLVKVGADLAAQYGGSTKDAVDALASAMRGESDPIERYGISLNETAVNAELAARGQSKLKGAALEQAKAAARVAIVQKQSADAQGAFGRESETLAGKQARLAAAWDNIKATIGESLLPVLTKLSGWMLDKGIPAVKDFFRVILNNDTELDTSKMSGAEKFGLAVLKVGVFIRDTVIPAVRDFFGWISGRLWPALKEAKDTILPGIKRAFDIVTGGGGKGGVGGAKEGFKSFGDIITEKVIPFVAKLVSEWLPYAAFQLRIIIETVKGAWGAFQKFNSIAIPAITGVVRTFLNLVGVFVNGAAKAFGWMPGIGPKLKSAATEFNKFRDKVNGALDGLKDKEVRVGVKMIAGSRAVMSEKSSGGGTNKAGGTLKFRTGGVLPGYTPGRDVHRFVSPTGGILDLSGGEPIMRPEFGRVVGKGWVDQVNAAARTGGTGGVRKILERQAFASGGVFPGTRLPSKRGITEGVDSATVDAVRANAHLLKQFLGGPGMGYKAQVAWARANMPWATVTSTVRNNNPASDHDKGRAIDLAGGNMSRIFDTIKGTFGTSAIRSLYYSPKGGRQVRFNRESNTPPHIFGTHFDHVHWAMKNGGVVPSIKPTLYDQGGVLKPGMTLVSNQTGRPETVLPSAPGELIDYDELAAAFARSGLVVEMDRETVGRLTAPVVTRQQEADRRNGLSRR